MEKLYHYRNPISGELTEARLFEEGMQPDNYYEKNNPGFVKCIYDIENDLVYEAATLEEIAIARKETIESIDSFYTDKINRLVSGWMQRKEFGDINEIPQSVYDERNTLRLECNQKISELGISLQQFRKITLNK